MAEPPAQRARRRNETQTNPDSQAAATQQLPAERARYDQQTIQSGSRQPSQQELTQQVPPQLQPRPGETQTNPGPSTAPTQQLPADGVRDDQQMTQSGSRQPSQQEPTKQPPPQLQPRPGETQTNPGPSTAEDSQAAATQQLPADGVMDDQKTTQSGSRQPSQQETTQQPLPQLQPRPGITEPVLRKISNKLGPEWRQLATHLGFSAEEIKHIMMDDPGQTENQIFNMLVKWKCKQSTSTDQREVLCTALMEIGRMDIAEDLLGITDTILREISKALASEWQTLGIHLGVNAAEIEHIVMDDPGQTENQIFNMLAEWRHQQSNSMDQRKELCTALIKIGRRDIAEDLLGITEPVLRKISNKLGSEWQKLATHLGLSAAEIKHIVMDDQGQTENQIFNMLVKWRHKQSTGADQRNELCTALIEIGRRDIAEDLLECPKVSIETNVARLGFNDTDLSNRLWAKTKRKLDSVRQLFSALLNPCDGELVEVKRGSVTFVVRFKSREGLKNLLSMYDTGELAKKLTEILITDELTTEDKSDLAIQATIPDYDQACRFFDELEKDQQKGISDPILHKISERLCSEWQKLATHLGLSAAEIDRIEMDDPGQAENQIFNMLAEWRGQQSTSMDQREVLCTALMEIGRRDIVENLLGISDSILHKISERLCSEWQKLAKHLGLSAAEIERIVMDDPGQMENQIFNVLAEWRRKQSTSTDQRDVLCTALMEIGRRDIAEDLLAMNLAESTAKSDMEAEKLFSEGDVPKATDVHGIGLSDERKLDVDPPQASETNLDKEHPEVPGISDLALRKISESLGSEWQKLATHLGLSAVEIEQIMMDDPGQTANQIFKMLAEWRRKQRDVLCAALIKIGKIDIAEDLIDFSDLALHKISERLGSEWQKLATHLGLSAAEIDRIEMDDPGRTENQILNMLVEWRHKQREVLCTALTKIGRTNIVDDLIGNSDPDLRMISNRLGSEWRKLATYLGLRPATIDRIMMDDPGQTENQIFNMLVKWRHQQSASTDQREVLCTTLMKIGRRDIAKDLIDEEDSSNMGEVKHTQLGESSTATTVHFSGPTKYEKDRREEKVKASFMTTGFPKMSQEMGVIRKGDKDRGMTKLLWTVMTTLRDTKGEDYIREQFSAFLQSYDGELKEVQSG